jgi:hypothetical protein
LAGGVSRSRGRRAARTQTGEQSELAQAFPDVEHKDRGIRVWCHTMREQTGQDWRYCRVDQLVFDKGQHVTFDALVAAVESARAQAPNLGLVIDGR